MKKLRLLLITSSDWSMSREDWLKERGYEVSVLSYIIDGNWSDTWLDFDLVLLDETVWLEQAPPMFEITGVATSVLILTEERSTKGYSRARKAGAAGYLSKGSEKDSFVREVERVLRKEGKLPRRGRVLIVDDDPRVGSALERRLEQEGYAVFVATNRNQALEEISTQHPHVAIVDFVLKGPKSRKEGSVLEPLDQSGFELIQEINRKFGHAMRVVGITAFTAAETAAKTTGRMAEFVYKDKDYVNEIVPKVEIALEQLGINFALDLDFENPLSLLSLVKMMKVYQDYNENEQKMVAVELEELLRKLFPDGQQAKGYYLSPGRGGSGVVLMRPTVQGIKGKLFVIKFGPRASIMTELEHYRNFAVPFIDHKAYLVDIANKPIQTLNLAGLKFSIAGESSPGRLRDFNSFYRDSSTTTQAISKVLDGVFIHTCKRWYEAKKDWPDSSPTALAHAYEMQLNLDCPEKQEQLATALTQLLHAKMLHGLTFRSHDYSKIMLTLGTVRASLPNPLLFVREQRTHFPRPRFSCITHGDLNGRNMFVDENENAWLIDFYQTGWGPILRDFGEMETVIKFELIQSQNVAALYEFEQAILSPASFDGLPPLENRFGISEFIKAKDAIMHLRSLAQNVYESTDMFEYYVGLLYYAMKMITWDGISSTDKDRLPIRQHHALMSAAMIAYRLQNWNSWSGWPREK